MSAADTRQFIGDTITVQYYNGSSYSEETAYYDSALTIDFSEVSDAPVGFVSGSHVWLEYSFRCYPNLNPQYISFKLHPQYSIFDTNYLYSCFALSSLGSPSTTYDSPQCNWYIGGSIHNFYNSSESVSGSGTHAYLNNPNYGSTSSCTYIPIVHSQAATFSAYSIDVSFNGNSYLPSYYYYFYVMCPYVSGNASGGSGTFSTASTGASGSDVNVNVTVNVDMSETNSLLGDILEGVAPISELVGLLSDDVEIPEAGTIVSMPYDDDDYDEMLMTADAILNDIPDTVAAAGFWVEITNSFFPQNSWLRVVMPLLMIMALMAWLLWKK